MQKRVLIISYFFNQGLIGSIRLRGLAKFLPEFGWEPTILTVESEGYPSSFRLIETNNEDIISKWGKFFGLNFKHEEIYLNKNSKLINFIRKVWEENIAYPDGKKYWYKFAVESGTELLESEKFDAIISSAFPYTSHLIAHKLKENYNIPWIADFRDLWTQNHYYNHSVLRKNFEQKLELKTMSNADLLTTVSKPLADNLKKLHNKRVYDIPNGFDPIIADLEMELSSKFNIVYTGSVYNDKMDPDPFFKALSELILEGNINPDDCEVDFFAFDADWLRKLVEKNNLESIVKFHGWIERDEVIVKQREAQLLLLLNWNDPEEKGVYTGKIFEYLAAKRPIISIGLYGGVIEDLLNETNAGVNLGTVNEIKNELIKAYSEFKTYNEVKYGGIPDKVDKYSHREMAKKFAYLLDTLT